MVDVEAAKILADAFLNGEDFTVTANLLDTELDLALAADNHSAWDTGMMYPP